MTTATTPPEKKPADVIPPKTEAATVPGVELRKRMGLPPPKAPEKTEEEIEAETEAAKKAAKPADKKPDAKKKPAAKVAPVAAAPTIDAEAIVDATSRGFRKAMDETEKKKEPKDTDGLSDEELENYKVLTRMGELNPARKTMAKDYVAAVKKLRKYQSDWESDHKGKKFNLADEEHADYLGENDFKWNEREYMVAMADMIADEKVDKKLKPLNEKLTAKEQAETLARKAIDEAPVVVRHQRVAARAMLNALGDEFANILDEQGNVNREEIGKLQAKGSVYKKMLNCADQTETVCGELKRIELGHVPVTEESIVKNPIHKEIWWFMEEKERELMALPEEDRVNQDGKQFAPSLDWAKMTPAQQKNHWTFNTEDLTSLYAGKQAKRAQALLADAEADAESIIKSKGYTKAEGVTPAPAPKAPAEVKADDDVENNGRNGRGQRPPAATIAPRIAPIGKVANGGQPSLLERRFGKR